MYRKFTVRIPAVQGKMTEKRSADGSVYVYYEYGRVYHKDRQYTIPKRVCVGKEDPENGSRMFPNDRYFEYFPEESALDTPVHLGGRSSCLRAGAHVVVDMFLKKYRLLEWLGNRFGEKDGGLVADLASYLLISERNTAQHYPDYAYSHPLLTPDMRIYSDSKVGRLLKESITRDDVIAFTEWWNRGGGRGTAKVYISYDATNKYCQAGDIDIVEGGHSKTGVDGQPVFNVSVALGIEERMPLFYEDYPGSVVDVTQLSHMVDKARGLGYRNIGFVLDRGYFSRGNISYMDENGYSFIMMVKGMKRLVSSAVLAKRGTFENRRACHIWEYSVSGTTVGTRLYEGDARERSLHIYFSPYRHSVERSEFELMLRRLSAELDSLTGKDCSGRAMEKYEKYYDLAYTGKDLRTLAMYREKTEETERVIDLCGYFCIVSSDAMSAADALRLYKTRDGSEKLFAADKTFLGSRSSRVQSEGSLRAKTFIEFIALIIRSRFYSCIADHVRATGRKPNFMNVVSVIAELEKIELVRIGDGVYRLDHAITARQKEILSVFGMSEEDMKERCLDISGRLAAVDAGDIRRLPADTDIRDDSAAEDEEDEQWQE